MRTALAWVGGNRSAAAGAALALVFGLSLGIYLTSGTDRVRRVLFFPDQGTRKLVGEEHFVPRAAGTEENIRALVKEMLLGPASFELARLVPKTAKVRSVSLRERILYVDFSVDMVLDAETVPLKLPEVVQGIANNLYFNFPRVRGVYVFVHGQIPELGDGDAGPLAYSRGIVR